MSSILDVAILGCLHEEPLHGYELRRRVARLAGHVRAVSQGTLYPAIKRMENDGLMERRAVQGQVAAPRHVLTLTDLGRKQLLDILHDPPAPFITDENRWFVLLSFLRHLPDRRAQAAVLSRRLSFLSEPSSYYYDGDRPLGIEDVDDPFRKGVLTIATATSAAEISWLRPTLAELTSAEPAEPTR